MNSNLDLNDKDLDPERLADLALHNLTVLNEIFSFVSSDSADEAAAERCCVALGRLGASDPEHLSPYWNSLVEFLRSERRTLRRTAAQVIANLACGDKEGRFEKILDNYFGLLNDAKADVAVAVARAAGAIVKSRPQLEPLITSYLLRIPPIPTSGGFEEMLALHWRGYVNAAAIISLSEYFDAARDKDGIREFIKKHERCLHRLARIKALEFKESRERGSVRRWWRHRRRKSRDPD